MQILAVIQKIITTPALLVGLVTLLGLLLQKKPLEHVIKGTVTAIVGFVVLSAGSFFLENGALHDFGELFNYDFHIQGVIPNMEAIASLGIARYAETVSEMMFFGMISNIIMARFSPFHYIFLTGHHTLYMACLLTIVLHGSGMERWQLLIAGSLILGEVMALFPALASKEMEKITGSNRIALGHFSTLSNLAAAGVARLIGKTEEKESDRKDYRKKYRSSEELHFPSKLSFMRDTTVAIFVVMTVMFLLLSGIAVMRTDLNSLNISYADGGYQSWVIYALIQGAQFSAAIYIILAGVRLIVAEIVPAFKGIAKKLVPHARPAVDCPVLFSYAPNAVMIGFLMSFLGGVVTMAVTAGINTWKGMELVPVIVPGVVAHFFCGGSAGVFANAEGGVRGCVIGSFVHGILITVLALGVMPMLGALNLSGTTFSDADFCVTGIIFGRLAAVMSGRWMFVLCVTLYALPIVWEWAMHLQNKRSQGRVIE